MEIDELNIPRTIKNILRKHGYSSLYPPQVEAINLGLLNGVNLIASIPTASGKTLIAELAIVNKLLNYGGKALYFTPLRALASEKYIELSKYNEAKIKVALSTGDYDSSDDWLEDYDIIVTTYEKADSLTRHRSKWINSVSVIVADEVHLINDGERGPILEILMAKLMKINPRAQIVALSATIRNAEELRKWIKNSKLLISDWRPVKLKEGVYHDGFIYFSDGEILNIPTVTANSTINIAIDTVRNGSQALIFTNSRQSAINLAKNTSIHVGKYIDDSDLGLLKTLSKEVLNIEPVTNINNQLANCIRNGVAFHHAGLTYQHRKIIEDNFRSRLIKVICATPTLAAGVNLPARRVIIDSYRRYEVGLGSIPISVLEYKQMAGRAGRPKYDAYGETVIISRSHSEAKAVLDRYIRGNVENLISRLASERALRTHVLALVASGFSKSFNEVIDVLKNTLFGHQQDVDEFKPLVTRILDFLMDEGMIVQEALLRPTRFGKRVSDLYIDPISAVIIRDGLLKFTEGTYTLSALHLICHTPDMPKMYLGRREFNKYLLFLNNSDLFTNVPNYELDYEALSFFLAEVKTALMLNNWINELSEDEICEKFNIGPGDIRTYVETASWLLYAASEIAEIFKEELSSTLKMLHKRVKLGVKEELIELVRLEGIGRIRARMLYSYGFKNINDLKEASIERLKSAPLIGEKLAKNIKQQLDALIN